MAFVNRSSKTSPFQPKSLKQQATYIAQNIDFNRQQQQIAERIHANTISCQEIKKSLNKKYSRLVHLSKEGQSWIQAVEEINPFRQKESHKKITYNFKDIKKNKTYQINEQNKENFFNKQQNKQLLKNANPPPIKSLKVKQKKQENKKNKKQSKQFLSTPGPGAYNLSYSSSVKAPKFHKQTNSNLLKQQDSQQQTQKKQKNHFTPKYDCMNTSCFKNSLGLVNKSNNLLLKKLFHQKQQTQKSQNMEYLPIQDNMPGPGQYNPALIKSKSMPKFGTQKRFLFKLPEGPNKYYNILQSISQTNLSDVNQNSCFCSTSNRFQPLKSLNLPLQYKNYMNSHIQQRKNRKQIPFNSTVDRNQIQIMDQRPYYVTQAEVKRYFLTSMAKYKSQRNLFNKNNQQFPSPTEYNVQNDWTKQHSCKIYDDPKQSCQNLNRKQNLQVAPQNFYLCSKHLLFPNKIQSNHKKGVLLYGKLSPPYKPLPLPQQNSQVQSYGQILTNLQKKSFNKYFTSQLLPANNPIKNKIL